jgi:photosystem II stability/assembly factor-like uncharacterized protein
MRLIGCAVLLAGCASYRALPGTPLRYEQTRFLFFTSIKDDVAVERIFAAGARIVAVVSRPDSGVFASSDGGSTWSWSKLEPLREVIFDGDRIVGRAAARLYRWEDGRWERMALNEGPIDALAIGVDHTILATARGRLFVSADGGRSFRAITLQVAPPFRIRSIAADPSHANTIYLSVRAERPGNFLPRVQALLDRSSDEALEALALVDGDALPPFGEARDGVYATHDGGALWKKTDLALDAWLAFEQGALYAVAADPLLEAAALSRRYPDLATALERQLHGDRADPASLRAACRFPGREALLGGAGPVYQASALSWRKIARPPPALFIEVARQRSAQGDWMPPEAIAAPPRSAGAPPPQDLGRVRSRSARMPPSAQRPARAFSPETLLALLDPMRLLARFNSALPLSGAARAGLTIHAYAPTPAYWELLASNMAMTSDSEGEISLGPGQAHAEPGVAPFELLRSNDGGATWSALPALTSALYPSSIAPGLLVLGRRAVLRQ